MLDLWVYGTHVATLETERRERMRLSYANAAIDRWGLGSRILTVAAPITRTRLTPRPTAAIVEGLLPEGEALDRLTRLFGAGPELLAELGRETIGAVVVVPSGTAQPSFDPDEYVRALTDDEIAARIRGLPERPLGVGIGNDVRLSLGGMQPKLLLSEVDGGLADPTFANPSTVILKPQPTAWPNLVDLEAWALSVAEVAGIPVVSAETCEFAGIRTLAVRRYDRDVDADVFHRRIHQEDLCMAVGALPSEKYATTDRSPAALARLAAVVYDNAAEADMALEHFVTTLVLNVAIGNADAHAKNLSLIHHPGGSIDLAPIYDIIPTYHYRGLDRDLAQPIDRNVRRIDSVTGRHLLDEVRGWGLPHADDMLDTAVKLVRQALDAIPLPVESPDLSDLIRRADRLKLP